MDVDEFNRKYHPFPALFNQFSKPPKLDQVHASRRAIVVRESKSHQNLLHLTKISPFRMPSFMPAHSSPQQCETEYDFLHDVIKNDVGDWLRRNIGVTALLLLMCSTLGHDLVHT